VAGLGLAAALAACGGDAQAGPPTITWYINPDNGGQAELAEVCTDEADGRYRIVTALLPSDADAQREQLIRRLAAQDDSVDLMSIDPIFVPEFAEAGFLAPVPEDLREQATEGTVESAVQAATYRDEIVSVPFWANTQLLWFRESVVEEAGIDPTRPINWTQVIEAADETDTTVAVQARRYEGYAVLLQALVAGAGGSVIENPDEEPEDLRYGLDSDAGRAAAEVIALLAESGVGGPALSSSDETAALSLFQGEDGGFMVNWPFVWRASVDAVEAGNLDQAVVEDIGWAVYPATVDGGEPAPPFGGIQLGVGAFTPEADLAYDAAACIVRPENQKDYFLSSGNPAAAAEVYDDPEVQEQYPMADTIRESLEIAEPRVQTPYYGDVSTALQRTFSPPEDVSPQDTPARATDLIRDVLAGEALL
jgi:multiple sugar transport system substrate-binding protein